MSQASCLKLYASYKAVNEGACVQAGPKEKLDSTAVSQPAIYVASLAALEKLKQDEGQVVLLWQLLTLPRHLSHRVHLQHPVIALVLALLSLASSWCTG